jgi:uncharacterized flavoprotein (TIGR03862 family)
VKTALVIGAGPAGLMAADVMSKTGLRVTVIDQKPSVGRKFLMAGKSGLNLTKAEDLDKFQSAYGPAKGLRPIIKDFGPDDVQAWAATLDQPIFTGSSGRVFPKAMKASPLLRAWLAKLETQGVKFQTRTKWTGWDGDAVTLIGPEAATALTPDVTVLAMGGASWHKLGSDGQWSAHFDAADLAPFQPSNFGLVVAWSDHMSKHFGTPLKNIALIAEERHRGEAIISAKGLEGGGIYAVSTALREGAPLALDLLPDMPVEKLIQRLSRPQGKASFTNHLRKALKLEPVKLALLQEFARPLPTAPKRLAKLIKALPIAHEGPRPIDEAISTSGGLRFEALDENLMLRDRPGTFAAGEMLDWEAPTGGYLITACLATGRWAGQAAARYAA